MDFVIFSYNYLPLNDAEALCTARFVNALAETGHHVHVVTMDHQHGISEELCHELVPAPVEVTRVTMPTLKKNFLPRVWYQTPEWQAMCYGECIRTLRTVLNKYAKPILVSRMCPDASGIVGWHCRKEASLWVNHFSDPFPTYLKGGCLGRIMNWFTYRWARRFISDSAFCTITCPDVVRFFQERVKDVSTERFVLVPHIGEPLIQADRTWTSPSPEKPYIAHAGNCYDGRYASELVRELLLCKQQGTDIAFVQAGNILQRDIDVLEGSGIDFRRIELKSPGEASAIFKDAAINLVIDLKIDFGGYTPFIPSKFVYLIYTDKPIVVFARKDSWMYRLATENPGEGIYFADVTQPGELAACLQTILGTRDSLRFERHVLRQYFSKNQCVQDFLVRCEQELDRH